MRPLPDERDPDDLPDEPCDDRCDDRPDDAIEPSSKPDIIAAVPDDRRRFGRRYTVGGVVGGEGAVAGAGAGRGFTGLGGNG